MVVRFLRSGMNYSWWYSSLMEVRFPHGGTVPFSSWRYGSLMVVRFLYGGKVSSWWDGSFTVVRFPHGGMASSWRYDSLMVVQFPHGGAIPSQRCGTEQVIQHTILGNLSDMNDLYIVLCCTQWLDMRRLTHMIVRRHSDSDNVAGDVT